MTVRAYKPQTRAAGALEVLPPEEHHLLSRVVGVATGDQKQVRTTDAPQETTETRPASNIKERGETLKEDLDRIIDEIDEVLEENAEEFVKNYVQRGGE